MWNIKNVIVFALLINITISCKHAEKIDYVFPPNYEGWAIIVYNCKSGDEFFKENNRIKIKIPDNGILFTSNKRPDGILDNNYYSFDNSGKLIKILSSMDSIAKDDSTSSYIAVESYQSHSFNRTDYESKEKNISTTDKHEKINLDEIVIFKISKGYSNTPITIEDTNKYMDSIIAYIVKNNIECGR